MFCTSITESKAKLAFQKNILEGKGKGGEIMSKQEAVERFISRFSAIPTEWVKIVAEKSGDEFYGIMWGTMFIVNDSVDKRRIKALLKPVEDEEDESRHNFPPTIHRWLE
jgi:hypothetical protein